MSTLSLFHPLIRSWFEETYGSPTDIQEKAWPVIASGKNALITAPTGSGKTLTAFLYAINRFAVNGGDNFNDNAESCRILYISPLKALNNDIQRNLRLPVEELGRVFARADTFFPPINIGVRSGDTTPSQRRKMEKSPPHIFITTPESLHILLSSKGGRKQLYGFTTVILDEIHAVAATKRGAFLMSAVERLTDYSGDFQRIGLSATVRPLPLIAEFIGGYRQTGRSGQYEQRQVTVLQTDQKKEYCLCVDTPRELEENSGKDWWKILSQNYLKIVETHTSTLLFANSRRLVEKLSRFINDEAGFRKVYPHHGSLAKEIRLDVEQRLKNGELSGIVATGSLELGIDVGAVDAVVLVQTPFSVSQAVQRIGRSGHRVGELSKGIFYPIHAGELLYAAVGADSILHGEIETLEPLQNPLDVLAQLILSMALYEPVKKEEIFAKIKRCWNYRTLSEKEFDLVVEMLNGRYADSRIRELTSRLYFDKLRNTLQAKDNTAMLLFMSGGVIPDRGYYTLRAADSKARIGELDEEFVWERSIGDAFPFGNKVWRIQRITHNDVEVLPVEKSNSVIPFWRADEQNRPYHFSKRIGDFLDEAEEKCGQPDYKCKLTSRYFLTDHAADKLIEYLRRQKDALGVLPGSSRVVAEHYNDPVNRADSKQTVLHTFWGGQVNRPYAFALAAAWEERYGYPLTVFANNDSILLNLPHDFLLDELIGLFSPEEIPRLLRKRLESTGYFGAKFRENAQRALLLPKKTFNERMPLWLNRLRSKKLLEAVKMTEDFPITLETWRECLTEDFDITVLARLIGEIQTGVIRISEAYTTVPSPFAEGIIWRQTNYFMYEDDSPGSKLTTNLSDELINGLIGSPNLIPVIPDEIIEELISKLQRTAPGYVPDTPEELLQHLRDRIIIPEEEWEVLLSAVSRETGTDIAEEITGRITRIEGARCGTAASENRGKLTYLFSSDASSEEQDYSMYQFISEWLQFYGPVPTGLPASLLTDDEKIAETVNRATLECMEEQLLVQGRFSTLSRGGGDVEICDRKNLEILLRLRRARQRPAIDIMPIENFQFFLSEYQGITNRKGNVEGFQDQILKLFGFPARAELWESDILPARCRPYYTAWMDSSFLENGLIWFGCGKEKIGFSFEEDLELYMGPRFNARLYEENDGAGKDRQFSYTETAAAVTELIKSSSGKIDYSFIASETGTPSREITKSLWELAWMGRVSNDTFSSLRNGIQQRFTSPPVPGTTAGNQSRRRPGRFSSNRWVRSLPFTGNWRVLELPGPEENPIETEELNKDRVRQLLLRYGVLFRELLQVELPDLGWSVLFRTLRLMELSGEITTGRFFHGIPGLQFCAPNAVRLLEKLHAYTSQENEDGLPIYWINAADPASLCGRGIDTLRELLPPRLLTTHLVFRGPELVIVSKRLGKELQINTSPEDPDIEEFCGIFDHLVKRSVKPVRTIKTETINSIPAADSPFADALLRAGFVKDYKFLRYRKHY